MTEEFVLKKAAMDEFYSADFIMHGSTGEDIRGIKNIKQLTSEEISAFPDLNYTIDDMVVEGDRVAIRFTLSYTHKGEFMGAPPTNKKVTTEEICIIRIAGGKFVEEWVKYDTYGFMQQLDLIPTQGKET